MKLKSIKLTGFKSFVDSTAVHLQSHLTGIVGPNGCGKSNIIDAVRWVMGEISAKQLRGMSMSDVIFNGSATRKAIGQASAELIFDNSDASLGGEYAKYNEIAIRREVNREGFSDYFLNNTPCRRKDITNIFLGTGLGQNSYAVIEQGMISRFVEAKPDDLRVFIEEAAGISKYKERRRETENRIKHTKENLSRLYDIVEEVNQQLKHLKSQANAAERYRKLKQEERQTKAELHTLYWRELNKKILTDKSTLREDELKYENGITKLHVLTAKIAELRTTHANENEKFNALQAEYYRVGSDITRLEQQIKHDKERHEELTKNLTEVGRTIAEITASELADQSQLTTLLTKKTHLETEIAQATVNVDRVQEKLQEAEQKMQLIQSTWDKFNIEHAKIQQTLEVAQTHIQHLEERIAEEQNRKERLTAELKELDAENVQRNLEKLGSLFTNLRDHQSQVHTTIVDKQKQIHIQREAYNKLSNLLDQIRNTIQELLGRKSSLEVLQQAALGANDTELVTWLKENNLTQNPRVMQKIDVTSGWEKAVETVLGDYLEAIGVTAITNLIPSVQKLTHGNITLVDHTTQTNVETHADFTSLASKISSPWSLAHLINGVYIAEDSTAAETMLRQLGPGESVVTKDGLWYGKGWLKVADASNPKSGVLYREQELQELNNSIANAQQHSATLEQELAQQQQTLVISESELQELQDKAHTSLTKYSNTESQLASQKTHLQHLETRTITLQDEIAFCSQNLVELNEQLTAAMQQKDDAQLQYSTLDKERQTLIQERSSAEQNLANARKNAEAEQQTNTNATLRLQLLQTQIDYLQQNLDRARERLTTLQEQKKQFTQTLTTIVDPELSLSQNLQAICDKHLQLENSLTLAKQILTALEHESREHEKQQTLQQEINDKTRLTLEKMRTEHQGILVRSTTYAEQVSELGLQLETVNATLPEIAPLTEWEEKLTKLGVKIERLGLINLAAIEECTKLEERKTYLTTQNEDLIKALNTLEEVIRKIDRETRERFQDAYQQINQNFQEIFPKVFNGGKASLEQTETNLLETGVIIMAQPPGKRNTGIHLLSGGEKALTASALIFAIFHLNPAPFCILDEVDAPLDDINIQRFCHLVQEMSKAIQFVFITHNKLTMEIAEQLIGVTMQEPGVSRLVTVDIDTAISFAQKH